MIEMPKQVWIERNTVIARLMAIRTNDNEVKYIRANRYNALLDAAASLHHWLFEMVKTYDYGNPRSFERDMLDDAQLAIDKYNRFLDGD